MKGIGVSSGIAMGQVYVDWKEQIEVEKEYVNDIEGELERLELAMSTVEEELLRLYGPKVTFEADDLDFPGADLHRKHGAMLHDREYIDAIRSMIRSEGVTAAWAVKTVSEKFAEVFEAMSDASLRTRADDVKDICARMCRLLLHVEGGDLKRDNREGLILVCKSMGTAESILVQKDNIAGLLCEESAIGSHPIIMARNSHKPAVVGLSGITDSVSHSDFIIVDGNTGAVYINPDEHTLAEYVSKMEQERLFSEKLRSLIGCVPRSADGESLKIYGNAATDRDIQSICSIDGRGVGLYRTEYIYLNNDHLPSEGEQFWEYKRALLNMKGRPVVFRTLDIGGDKTLPYLNIPRGDNPALALRGIRYSFSRVDIFRSQVRAILRAGAFGEVSILLPLISSVNEVIAANVVIRDVMDELSADAIAFNPETKIGVMIETPAAAVTADLIAEQCDFLSIGSNDLIQYTMAADRLSSDLAYLYSPFYPAVLRMVRHIIDSGKKAGIPVNLCGEMAGDPLLSPILFGMGLRNFSVNPFEMLRTQWILSCLKADEMKVYADEVMRLETAKKVERYCEEHFGHFLRGEEFPDEKTESGDEK